MVWNTTYSGGILGGNEDFHKHNLTLEWYSPLVSKFVLVNTIKAGVIGKIETDDENISIIHT